MLMQPRGDSRLAQDPAGHASTTLSIWIKKRSRCRHIETSFMLYLHITALSSSLVSCGVPSMLLVAL